MRELTLDPGPGFRFVPGQWVTLRIPRPGDEVVPRAYSIASPPRADGCFDVAVTRVPGGLGSEVLHALPVGSALACSHAQGFFTPEPRVRPVLMVGTGTGVAPLRAMLLAARDEPADDAVPTTLVLGVRAETDLLYGDDFAALARAAPWFRFVPTLSRGSDAWTGARGYVQLHVPALVRELGGACDAYACGLNRMIREVRAVLKGACGLPRERIHTERYD